MSKRKCEFEDCNREPSFNMRGEKRGKFCKDHKYPEMIDVVSKTCEHTECDSHPIFNMRGETRGKFCKDHKHPEMINVVSKTVKLVPDMST